MPHGYKHTPETLAKMSASHHGHAVSAEHRAKTRAALLGHSVSAETREKIGHTGRETFSGLRRESLGHETRMFGGQEYWRTAHSPTRSPNFRFHRRILGQLNAFLSRDMWSSAHGPIPEGCVIHHINGDKSDDRLENLECLTNSEHVSLHRRLVAATKRRGLRE